jgi:hypothetical protein
LAYSTAFAIVFSSYSKKKIAVGTKSADPHCFHKIWPARTRERQLSPRLLTKAACAHIPPPEHSKDAGIPKP